MHEEAKSKIVTEPYVRMVYERLGTKKADEYYKPNRARKIERQKEWLNHQKT
jgi:hypothetical protein